MSNASNYAMTPSGLRTKSLPLAINLLIAVAAIVVSAAVVLGTGFGGYVLVAVIAGILYLIGLAIVAGRVEGRRSATNRVWQTLIYTACVLAILPLASVVWTLISKGVNRLDGNFF